MSDISITVGALAILAICTVFGFLALGKNSDTEFTDEDFDFDDFDEDEDED